MLSDAQVLGDIDQLNVPLDPSIRPRYSVIFAAFQDHCLCLLGHLLSPRGGTCAAQNSCKIGRLPLQSPSQNKQSAMSSANNSIAISSCASHVQSVSSMASPNSLGGGLQLIQVQVEEEAPGAPHVPFGHY